MSMPYTAQDYIQEREIIEYRKSGNTANDTKKKFRITGARLKEIENKYIDEVKAAKVRIHNVTKRACFRSSATDDEILESLNSGMRVSDVAKKHHTAYSRVSRVNKERKAKKSASPEREELRYDAHPDGTVHNIRTIKTNTGTMYVRKFDDVRYNFDNMQSNAVKPTNQIAAGKISPESILMVFRGKHVLYKYVKDVTTPPEGTITVMFDGRDRLTVDEFFESSTEIYSIKSSIEKLLGRFDN